MKKCKTFLIFALLFLTWAALFRLTGSKTPWQIFTVHDREAGTVVPLGEMAGRNYDRMGFDGGEILSVKSDGGWLIGTANGELLHLSKEGKELWSHSVGSGLIRSIAVSRDEKTVYAGEKSPDGYLYALDVKTGDVKWKCKGYDIIGGEPDIRADPQPIHVATDREGNVYAVFYRFTLDESGTRRYVSRIVSFTAGGDVRWKYPENGNMDAWVNWGDDAEGAHRFAFGTANYDKTKIKKLEYNKNIYVLDDRDGTLVHTETIPTADHFQTVAMRNGPSFSEDGKYLTATTSDGRGFLYDSDGNLLWQRTVAEAKDINGTWFFAAGRDAMVVPEGVLFATINTFGRDNWQMPSPVIHPANNSLYLFGLDGRFLFRYRAPGEIEGVSTAKGMAALAVGRNVRNHDYHAHGAAIVSLSDGKERHYYHTAGPLQAIALSSDGKWAAGIEVPAVTPEGNLLGDYRLHIWNVEGG